MKDIIARQAGFKKIVSLVLIALLVFIPQAKAATTTLTHKEAQITVPANTTEHDINFSNVLKEPYGTAIIVMKTGTAVQFSADGTAIDANSITLSSSGNNTKAYFAIKRGVNIRYKGGAGSETFNINILP